MFLAFVDFYLRLAGLKNLGTTEFIKNGLIVLKMVCKGLTIIYFAECVVK